jgi:abortive infection bacteriophage resistance protein
MVGTEELRFRNYFVLKPDDTLSAQDLFIFDLHLRALVMKAMAIIETELQLQLGTLQSNRNFLTFGDLRKKISSSSSEIKQKIAVSFGCKNPRELAGLLLNFNEVRNLAAHHSRLWNRNFHYAIPEKRLFSIKTDQVLAKHCNSFAASFLSIESVLEECPSLIDFRTEFEDLLSRSPIDSKFLLSGMGFEAA